MIEHTPLGSPVVVVDLGTDLGYEIGFIIRQSEWSCESFELKLILSPAVLGNNASVFLFLLNIVSYEN